MKKMLELKNLVKKYHSGNNIVDAVNDIDMDIYEGEFVGVMGPSGSGKTTLLNMISTIDKPTDGKIIIGGSNIVEIPGKNIADFRRKNIGFIFQDFNLIDTLTVEENIVLPMIIGESDKSNLKDKFNEIVKILNIEDIINKFPYEISGGQKQRTAAARAIITNPAIVLADEPTGALDSKSARELLSCMTKMNKEHGTTIMMVTHDPFSASYCDRVMFIKDGRINCEIRKSGNRKEFFRTILDNLKALGGAIDDII